MQLRSSQQMITMSGGPSDNVKPENNDEISLDNCLLATQCCGCLQSFDTYEQLQEHARLSHKMSPSGPQENGQLCCTICWKFFYKRYVDKIHQLEILRGRLQSVKKWSIVRQCCSCTATFMNDAEGKEHSEVHRVQRIQHCSEKPYECEFCFKRYALKSSLMYHKRHSYSYKQKRDRNNRICNSFQNRIIHEPVCETGVFRCCGCKRSFESQYDLYQHGKSDHLPYRRHEDQENPLECNLCYSRHATELQLDVHKSLPYNPRVLCDKCPEMFGRTTFWSHVHRVHKGKPAPVKSELTLLCDCCGAKFKTKHHLKSHMLTHAIVKQYRCEQCMQEFRWKHALQAHLRCHDGKRAVACEQCSRHFYSERDRRYHEIAVHTKEYPLKCEQCGKGFIRQSMLQKHLTTMHSTTNIYAYGCAICARCYTSSTGFHNHLKKSHGITMTQLSIKL